MTIQVWDGSGQYPWPYLQNEERVNLLKELLEPVLSKYFQKALTEEVKVFDFNCGYSPLASWLLFNRLKVIGNDISEECIEYLMRQYPSARWMRCSDLDINRFFTESIDILLHLGVSGDAHDYESRNEVMMHNLLKEESLPELVILEISTVYKMAHPDVWNNIHKSYTSDKWNIVSITQYEFTKDTSLGLRDLVVYERRRH